MQWLTMADLVPDFWELSYDLFRDRAKMHARFICDDIFDDSSGLMRDLAGKIDIMISGDFLHLFDWNSQVEAASRMVRLGRAHPGTIIIGKQVGWRVGRAMPTKWGSADEMFLHDEQTFARMWSEVEKRTKTKWDVRTRTATFGEGGFWAPKEDFAWMGEDAIGLQFVLRRLDSHMSNL